MTINSTSGAHIYIGPKTTAEYAVEDFEAVSDWTEIDSTTDLGSWGPKATLIESKQINKEWVRRLAGTKDAGTVELKVDYDALDEGQNIARAGIGKRFAFKVTLDDAPNEAGTPTVYYFGGVIGGTQSEFGDGDKITSQTLSIGIDGALIWLPATYAITMTPSAGALTGGTKDVAYSATTFDAEGGDGAVSYSVAAGALPTGISLNAATGALTGTPTVAGSYNFTIKATFSLGGSKSQAYSLVIAP